MPERIFLTSAGALEGIPGSHFGPGLYLLDREAHTATPIAAEEPPPQPEPEPVHIEEHIEVVPIPEPEPPPAAPEPEPAPEAPAESSEPAALEQPEA